MPVARSRVDHPGAHRFIDSRALPIEFCTTPDRESLIWVANLGCIEMHPWLSRVSHADAPDFAIFDLDPQEGCTWEQVVYVAGLVNVLLERLGLAGYAKTSGASGIHIYVPLEPLYTYSRVRAFVETARSDDRLGGSRKRNDGMGHRKARGQKCSSITTKTSEGKRSPRSTPFVPCRGPRSQRRSSGTSSIRRRPICSLSRRYGPGSASTGTCSPASCRGDSGSRGRNRRSGWATEQLSPELPSAACDL